MACEVNRKRNGKNYKYIKYKDADGRWHFKRGFDDKSANKNLMAKLITRPIKKG